MIMLRYLRCPEPPKPLLQILPPRPLRRRPRQPDLHVLHRLEPALERMDLAQAQPRLKKADRPECAPRPEQGERHRHHQLPKALLVQPLLHGDRRVGALLIALRLN